MDRVELEEAVRRARDLVTDLRHEAGAIAESTAAGPDDEHDVEGSSIGFERRRVAALLSQVEASLLGLEAALARQLSGEYGICGSCHKTIDPERLAALPTAELCIDCARSRPRA
jgi:RNA polymerase-binding transcription factor DksA